MIEKIEKNDQTISLNVLYTKKWEIHLAYVSIHNSNGKKQVIFLMIPNGEGWHYLGVKEVSALLRGITLKHHSGFYVWIAFILLQVKTNLNFAKKVCENKDFCNTVMSYKTLKY